MHALLNQHSHEYSIHRCTCGFIKITHLSLIQSAAGMLSKAPELLYSSAADSKTSIDVELTVESDVRGGWSLAVDGPVGEM